MLLFPRGFRMWYYANNGEQVGPLDEGGFVEAIASGVISNDTLVWREGMADWQPLKISRPQSPPALPRASSLPTEGAEAIIMGQPLQTSHTLETVPSSTVFTYADFWIRFAAKVFEIILIIIVSYIFIFLCCLA